MLRIDQVREFEEYVRGDNVGALYDFYQQHPEILGIASQEIVRSAHEVLVLRKQTQRAGEFYEAVRESGRSDLGELMPLLEQNQNPEFLKLLAKTVKEVENDSEK